MSRFDPNDDRRAQSKVRPVPDRVFHHTHLDPVTVERRPLLTVGNVFLALLMLIFGLYATGNLPQLDAALDGLQANLQSHNDIVVGQIIRLGPFVVLGLMLIALVWSGLGRLQHRASKGRGHRNHDDERYARPRYPHYAAPPISLKPHRTRPR